MLDSQARSDTGGFQENAEIGKLIHGLLGWDKLIPESMAQYQAGRPTFRLAAKPEPEARMWMIEGMAGGIQPWWHYVGASHEDRRIYHTAGPIFRWHTENTTSPVRRRSGGTLHTYLRLKPELRKNVDGPRTGLEPSVDGVRHAVLKGFDETDILSFGGKLFPLKTDPTAEVLMTFIPEFPIYPPETAWMREPYTDIPGLVVNKLPGGGLCAFLPADIDRQYGRYNLPDHGNLLANIIRWAARDNIPLHVECKGLIDCNLYHQQGRLILHLVNLTSSATWRQPVDEFIPAGPLKISIRLTDDVRGNNLKLLVSGNTTASTTDKGWCHFTIASITDHEVVVIN